MNPAYLLAYKLGIPFVAQPYWNAHLERLRRAKKLYDEGMALFTEGVLAKNNGLKVKKAEIKNSRDMIAESTVLKDTSMSIYVNDVASMLGISSKEIAASFMDYLNSSTTLQINPSNGEVKSSWK